MSSLSQFKAKTVVLNVSNIDTDQIIPARFLTTTTRAGLGQHAFDAWRYQSDGRVNEDFVLNQAQAQGCEILVAGENFGCGSSREHAPWALLDFGFKAVISNKIADIFRSNALKNGLLAIVVNDQVHEQLISQPGAELVISLENNSITLPDHSSVQFEVEPFARHCLMQGVDQLGYLLGQDQQISQFEENR
ncbi:MAG: 3-isopropylmalate dehydratase small subunit [bacterium]